MNFSTLLRMARQGDLSADACRYLLSAHGECEWLDYKEQLNLSNDAQLSEFVRDVLGMKNVGGGYIVVGVRDKTWEPVGLASRLPYDTKLLREKVLKACGVQLDLDVVQHELDVAGTPQLFALILVRSTGKWSKLRNPTMVKKPFQPNIPHGLRLGEIIARRGDSTIQLTQFADLTDLLDQLKEISAQSEIETLPSPFAIDEAGYRLLDKNFDSFIGREALRQQALDAVSRDPRIWIINVHGPGGVGKSALATWVAYTFYEQRAFEAILHLTAKETELTQEGISRLQSRTLTSLEGLLEHILDVFPFHAETPEGLDGRKKLACEYLCTFTTLLVLDNMETVGDGRILKFVQDLPPQSKAKVLLTSREKSGGWELPVPVTELVSSEEVEEFIRHKAREMSVNFPLDRDICEEVRQSSGGLPLAIQWIIGRYKREQNIRTILRDLKNPDSPVLEFSFRRIWDKQPQDAKDVLAVMTIFDDPPSPDQLAMALEWRRERIEAALGTLEEVTLVNRATQPSDGRVTFSALPITLSFARHELDKMGDLGQRSHQRMRRWDAQMELLASERAGIESVTSRFGLRTDNEQRAAIIIRRATNELSLDDAAALYKQARDLAPQNAYVYAMSAKFEMGRGALGQALDFAREAIARANRRTGGLSYTTLADVYDYDKMDRRLDRAQALAKALEYEPNDVVTRHKYGVALSRAGQRDQAVTEFTRIIEQLRNVEPIQPTLMMALYTRALNLGWLKRRDEAARDKIYGQELIAKYPYLQSYADDFRDVG